MMTLKPRITVDPVTMLLCALVIAFVVGVALSACGSEQRSAAAATPASPRAVTAQETKLLDRARQILVRRCMSRHGFKVWITSRTVLPHARRFLYVVDDVAWARKHGFGADIERRAAKRGRSDPNMRYFSSLSPSRRKAALRALNGARPEGCKRACQAGSSRVGATAVARRTPSGCCTAICSSGIA
jgi:hypothetical protein